MRVQRKKSGRSRRGKKSCPRGCGARSGRSHTEGIYRFLEAPPAFLKTRGSVCSEERSNPVIRTAWQSPWKAGP